MTEVINIDEKVEKAALDPAEFEYPMVDEVPEGWPGLKAIEGKTWYQRALKTEQMTGRRVLPSKYTYGEDGSIILDPNYVPNSECEDGDCEGE